MCACLQTQVKPRYRAVKMVLDCHAGYYIYFAGKLMNVYPNAEISADGIWYTGYRDDILSNYLYIINLTDILGELIDRIGRIR